MLSDQCHQLLESAPLFTSPSEDFESHSQQLSQLVQEVYRLRDSYFVSEDQLKCGTQRGDLGKDGPYKEVLLWNPTTMPSDQFPTIYGRKQALAQQKIKYLESLIGRVIERLNLLTKPAIKKKKKRQVVQDDFHSQVGGLNHGLSETGSAAGLVGGELEYFIPGLVVPVPSD